MNDLIADMTIQADKEKAEALNISLECLLLYRLIEKLDNLTVTTIEP